MPSPGCLVSASASFFSASASSFRASASSFRSSASSFRSSASSFRASASFFSASASSFRASASSFRASASSSRTVVRSLTSPILDSRLLIVVCTCNLRPSSSRALASHSCSASSYVFAQSVLDTVNRSKEARRKWIGEPAHVVDGFKCNIDHATKANRNLAHFRGRALPSTCPSHLIPTPLSLSFATSASMSACPPIFSAHFSRSFVFLCCLSPSIIPSSVSVPFASDSLFFFCYICEYHTPTQRVP